MCLETSDLREIRRNEVSKQPEAGFTLLETLVVMSVISVLSAVAMHNLADLKTRSQVASVASELRMLSAHFEAYYADNEEYPADSHLGVPAGMESVIEAAFWNEETPLGGNYNWEGPDGYSYAGISIFGSSTGGDTFQILDHMLDDGNLFTGRFQVMSNGRPTLMLDGVPG